MTKLKEFRNALSDERRDFYHKTNPISVKDASEYDPDVKSKLDRTEYKDRIRSNFKGIDD